MTLVLRDPDFYTLRVGSRWFHGHMIQYAAPYFSTRLGSRFGGPFGSLYLAKTPEGAFIETIGRDFVAVGDIPMASVAQRGFSVIEVVRTLHLVDITGRGKVRAGVEGSLTASGPDRYAVSQKFAQAAHDNSRKPDGIRYRCRHDQEQIACVLFGDRASGAVKTMGPCQPWLQDRVLLARILERYRFGLLPPGP